MKLQLQEATPADLDAAKSIYGPEEGDLCAVALAHCWPLSDPGDLEAAKRRAEWSCQQQKDLLETDPTTRFVKVVDSDNNDELVAFGRWHRYPNGYEEVADVETIGLKDGHDPTTWPRGLHKDLYLGILDELWPARHWWIGNQHCWSEIFPEALTILTDKGSSFNERENAGAFAKEWSRLIDSTLGS